MQPHFWLSFSTLGSAWQDRLVKRQELPSAYYSGRIPWIKGLPREALLLTSLSSWAARLAGTILLRPSTVCHEFGERRFLITGAHLCYTLQLLHAAWTRTRKSRHHGKIQQTALHSTKDPSISLSPSLCEIWYGFNWYSSFSQSFLPCLLDTWCI